MQYYVNGNSARADGHLQDSFLLGARRDGDGEVHFATVAPGFTAHVISRTAATVEFRDVDGDVLHAYE